MKFLWCDEQEMKPYEKTPAKWLQPDTTSEAAQYCVDEDCIVSIGHRPIHLRTLEKLEDKGVDAIIHFHSATEEFF